MLRVAALLVAGLALAGCGGDETAAPTTATTAAPAPAAAEVKELTNVLDLRADFEADAGERRAIVLLSPT
jgi:ABC-type glycerol-3-phosphate transport system substrate-binding protein